MSKGLRWTGAVLALFAAILAAALLFAKQIVEFAASSATGRDVQIAGAFSIDYALAPTMHASEVTVSNPDWSERRNMLSAEAIAVQVDLRALLHGNLVLPRVRLQSPVLFLEKAAQGPANWQFGKASKQQGSANDQQFWMPSIEHLVINDARVAYYRPGKSNKLTATVDTLEARAAHRQPLSLSASGAFEGEPYKLSAHGGPTGSLMDASAGAYPFSMQLKSDRIEIHASGKLGEPLTRNDSDIQWRVEGNSLASVLAGKGHAGLDKGYSAVGSLHGNGEKWKLSGLHAQLGKTELHGSAALDTAGSKPFLRANLNAPVVDRSVLEALAAAWRERGDKAGGEAASSGSAWERLRSFNAQARLSVDRITGTGLPLGDLVMNFSLTDGKLNLDPVRGAIGNGRFSATLNLDASAPSRDGTITMQFERVPLAPLMDLLPYEVDQGGVLGGSLSVAFTADAIGAADGHLRYQAASADTSLEINLDRVHATGQNWPVRLTVGGRLRGAPLKGKFTGQPIALLRGSDMLPVSLDIVLADYSMELKGSVAGAGSAFDLDLAMSGPGTGKLSRIIGMDLPALPGFDVSAHLSKNSNLIRVDGLQARIGRSRFSGSLATDDLRIPDMLRVDLKAQTLAYADFDQLATGRGTFPDVREWLAHVDAEVRLAAQRIIGPDNSVYRHVILDASLQNGRLQLAPLRFAAGGGSVSATATVVDAASGHPTGSLNATVEHVRLSKALKPFDLGHRFPGVLDADIHFTTDPEKQQSSDSTIRYRDGAAGTDARLTVSSSTERMRIKGRGRFQHEPFRLDGTAGAASRLASAKPYPFDVDFKALATSGHLAGTIEQPQSLDRIKSTLSLSGPNPRRTESVVGFRLPELPPYSLRGTLTRRDNLWRFSDFTGKVGNTDLSGSIRVDNSRGKPRVRSVLHSKMLDFDDLGGIIGAAPGDGPGDVISSQQKEKAKRNRERSKVLPDEAFEFPSFLGFDADVQYSAARVDAGKLPIDSLQLTFQVKDGRLHLAPLILGAGGGTIRMNMHLVDKPGETPVRGRVKVDISRVSAARLLDPFDLAAGTTGWISGRGEFRTSGESVASMMGSLNGKASLWVPDGQLNARLVELAGLDAGEALLLGLEKRQTTHVNCAYIGVSARNGKVGIDTGLVDTTDTKLTMDGAIDLDSERFDLTFLAHPKDASLLAARAPLILEGTFRNPDFHPSWGSLLARGAAALALGAVMPPAALLAFVEPGLGESGIPCR